MIRLIRNISTLFRVVVAAYQGRAKDTLELADKLVDEKEREKWRDKYPFCAYTQEGEDAKVTYHRKREQAERKMYGDLQNSKCSWLKKRN
jgi:hypothetical protein